MEMCEPSIHNKHFQTAVILTCQLININEETLLETGGVLYQHQRATLGLDYNDTNVFWLFL